jgi:hypothetical protein
MNQHTQKLYCVRHAYMSKIIPGAAPASSSSAAAANPYRPVGNNESPGLRDAVNQALSTAPQPAVEEIPPALPPQEEEPPPLPPSEELMEELVIEPTPLDQLGDSNGVYSTQPVQPLDGEGTKFVTSLRLPLLTWYNNGKNVK